MKRIAVVLSLVPGLAAAQMLGPTPYLEFADSPFSGGTYNYFYLETFEDGELNVPGVTTEGSGDILVLGPSGITDSVDADDGFIDGFGTDGHSLNAYNGNPGIKFVFNESILGVLPTHAGVVWTDGEGLVSFEAFDRNGVSLGSISADHADLSFGGTTGEDRFYGFVSAGGIGSIQIWNASGGLEADHLQYGHAPVPEPSTMLVLAASLATARRRRAKAKASA